jgi:flagellar biosynthesis protein FlhG
MDVILVDLGPGVQESVLSLHNPAWSSVVILTPEPTSLADAYGLIKLLRRDRGVRHVSVIVNQVTEARDGLLTFQRLRDVAARFVDIQLEYLGHCPKDEKFAQSVVRRKILLDSFGEASATRATVAVRALELLAKRIRESLEAAEVDRGRAQEATAPFWRVLMAGETGEGVRA